MSVRISKNHIFIVNKLIPEKFERFIQEVMSKREKMLIKKRRMEVDALPEFKNIIRMSKHVSCRTYKYI